MKFHRNSIGIHGKAFFLDCLNLKYELVNFPSNWKFCLIDSEVQRNLRSSSYNDRFNELKIAEKELDVLNKEKRGAAAQQLAMAIGVTSQIASNAAPVLALTGVGLPLAAGLFVVGKLIQINAEMDILSKLVQDCKFILGSKYQLYQIILTKNHIF